MNNQATEQHLIDGVQYTLSPITKQLFQQLEITPEMLDTYALELNHWIEEASKVANRIDHLRAEQLQYKRNETELLRDFDQAVAAGVREAVRGSRRLATVANITRALEQYSKRTPELQRELHPLVTRLNLRIAVAAAMVHTLEKHRQLEGTAA